MMARGRARTNEGDIQMARGMRFGDQDKEALRTLDIRWQTRADGPSGE
jgi:hypothetical protein